APVDLHGRLRLLLPLRRGEPRRRRGPGGGGLLADGRRGGPRVPGRGSAPRRKVPAVRHVRPPVRPVLPQPAPVAEQQADGRPGGSVRSASAGGGSEDPRRGAVAPATDGRAPRCTVHRGARRDARPTASARAPAATGSTRSPSPPSGAPARRAAPGRR